MKYAKYFLVMLFLSLSMKIYPQYLESSDINRFRDNLSRFPNFFHVDIFHTNWDYYHVFRETVEDFGYIQDIVNYMEEANARDVAYSFKEYISNLLHYNVPEVINNKYQSIGLLNNGHQKVTVIIFGALYIYMQDGINHLKLILERGYDDEIGKLDEADSEEIRRAIKMGEIYLDINYGLFGERDLYILRNNIEFAEEIIDMIPRLNGSGYDKREQDGG